MEGRKEEVCCCSFNSTACRCAIFWEHQGGLYDYRKREPIVISPVSLLHLRYIYKSSLEVGHELVDRTFRYAGAWQ
jgi:hypothetical protein